VSGHRSEKLIHQGAFEGEQLGMLRDPFHMREKRGLGEKGLEG